MQQIFPIIVLLICFAPIVVPSVAYAEIIGQASVIDGDTIEIHSQKIRLFGIDAPESNQLCEYDGKEYRCGQKAAFMLDEVIAKKTVRCEGKDKDKYGRIIGECLTGSINLNEWMVSNGWALAYRQYSHAFVQSEEKAKTERVGIWAGTFQNPWDYRHNQPSKKSLSSDKCLIKGNINSKGEHIYHVPGTSWYGKTKIDTSKGEQWFCSEDQARVAGWRRAKSR